MNEQESPERSGSLIGRIGADLERAWAEHRRYVGFAFAIFVLGLLAGITMELQGVDLLAMMGLESVDELFPEDVVREFGVTTILANNTRVFAIMVFGALTLGLFTVFGLGFNGLFLGWFGTQITIEEGVGFTAVGILPHGIPELFAFFVAAGVGFRIVHMAVRRLRGTRDVVLGRAGWRRAALLLVGAWVLLALASVIEVHVSAALLELLFA